MTKCILMNFDDRIRVVHNIEQEPVELRVGALQSVDLNPITLQFIQSAMKTHNDPLVALNAMPHHPPEVLALMTLLQDLDTADYDDVLRRCIDLMGADNVGGPRPSRQELRFKLRVIAQTFAAGVEPSAAAIQNTAAKVEAHVRSEKDKERRIQDDVDPDQLDEDLRKQREADRKRHDDSKPLQSAGDRGPAPTQRDRMDEALGIITGGSVNELAGALGEDDPEADPDAFIPAKAGRQKRPSKKAASKGAKKPAPKPTAVSGKRSPPAKKPLGRIKA